MFDFSYHVEADALGFQDLQCFEEIKSAFLDASHDQWENSHDIPQSAYLKSLTITIIQTLLPEDKTHFSVEGLSSILSENVLNSLLSYLIKQENLLKIIIKVFSDNSDQLLSICEVPAPNEGKQKDCRPECEAVLIAGNAERICLNTADKDEITAEASQSNLDSTLTPSLHPDAIVSSRHQSQSSVSDDSFEHIDINPDEFVSEELNKFFKVAPSESSHKALEVQSLTLSSLPMTLMTPATNYSHQVDRSESELPKSATSSRRSSLRKAKSLEYDEKSSDSGLSEETIISKSSQQLDSITDGSLKSTYGKVIEHNI